jgi:hypothetical protein
MTAPENPTSNVEQAIGEVLDRHTLLDPDRDGPGGWRCTCGTRYESGWTAESAHRAHVAEQVAAVVAGVRAEAERMRGHLDRIADLSAEHIKCTGCPTPWWLTEALTREASER